MFAFAFPNTPLSLFAYLPSILVIGLGLIVLRYLRPNIAVKRLVVWRGRKPLQSYDPLFVTVVCCVLYLVITSTPTLLHNAISIPTGGDATQYLAQAQDFATHRTTNLIIGGEGREDGSLRGDMHGPFWTAYLASSVAAANISLEQIHPSPAGAIIVTVPLFLLALYTLFNFRSSGTTFGLLLLFVLSMPVLGYIGSYASREAFRIIPLILLCGLLLSYVRRFPEHQERLLPVSIVVFMLCFFTAAGHTLSIFLLPLLLVGSYTSILLGRSHPTDNFKYKCQVGLYFAVASVLGSALGFSHLIINYVSTGTPTGGNVTADEVLLGTPYFQHLIAYNADRVTNEMVLTWPVLYLVSDSVDFLHKTLAVFGVLIAIYALVTALKRGFTNQRSSASQVGLTALSLILLCEMLLFFGIFDYGVYQVSKWLPMNFRYTFQHYIFFATLCSIVLVNSYERLTFWTEKKIRQPEPRQLYKIGGTLFAILSVIALTVTAQSNLDKTLSPVDPTTLQESVKLFESALTDKSENCLYLNEVDQLTYYWSRPRRMLFSLANRPLFTFETNEEIDSYFEEKQICGIAAYSNFIIATLPPDLPLARYLRNEKYISMIGKPDDYIRFYIRQDQKP